MNVPSPHVLAYLSQQTIADRGTRELVWKSASSEFCILVLSYFISCTQHGVSFRCNGDPSMHHGQAPGILFPLPSRLLGLVDDDILLRVFDDCSFNLALASLAFKRFQEVDWSEAACSGGLCYEFSQGIINRMDSFKTIGRKREPVDEMVL